jgi:pimeloyl-ACP methyl ester carboxylesterase
LKEHLVMVPGIDGTGQLFYRQIPRLEKRFAVSATPLREDAQTIEDLVADLDRHIDDVAGQGARVTLFGESFGGALILSYALAHPERVNGLVILNSFSHFESAASLWLGQQLLRITPWSLVGLVRRLNARRMHSLRTERQEIRHYYDLMRATTRKGYLSRMRMLRSYDVRPQLASVTAPALFLAADRDTLVRSVDQARLMSTQVPHGTMRVLEGHGHSCLIAPDMDLAAILDDWRPDAHR